MASYNGLFVGTYYVYTAEVGNDDYGEELYAKHMQDVEHFVLEHEQEVADGDRYFIIEMFGISGYSEGSYQFYSYEDFIDLPIFNRGVLYV